MRLNTLKEMMLLPQNEINIKKSTVINDIEIHFMCLTQMDDTRTIWAIFKHPNEHYDQFDAFDHSNMKTYREEMEHSIERNDFPPFIQISKFDIQEQSFTVSSSSSGYLSYDNHQDIMRLQHFMEHNLIPDALMDCNLRDMCFAYYSQIHDESPVSIDPNQSMAIEMTLAHTHKSALINTSLTVGFNQTDIEKHSFYNPLTGQECTYYLHPLEIYDPWAKLDEFLTPKNNHHPFSEDQVQTLYKQTKNSIESICPKNHKLAILKYESDEDITLSFYTKKHLDKGVSNRENSYESDSNAPHGASSIGFIISSDEKFGPNGLPLKFNNLKAVKGSQVPDFDIELFSVTKTFPEIKIKF